MILISRDEVTLIRRYTGGGTVVVDENTGKHLPALMFMNH